MKNTPQGLTEGSTKTNVKGVGDGPRPSGGPPAPQPVPMRFGAEGCAAQLPKYQCHKQVWALKIAAVHDPSTNANEAWLITPVESGYASFVVSDSYIKKHNPQAGGYWVQYKGGYQSYSPAEEFEDGYTRM